MVANHGAVAGTSRIDPFVGRRDELRQIADALAERTCPGVVLVGQSGVGKTELARHAVTVAAASGFATAAVHATRAASSIPLGALTHLIGVDVTEGPVATLRSARSTVTTLAGDGPLVLLVDDAHVLDDMSATLVHQLVGDDNIFVISTVRTGTSVPDAVTALWKDAGAHRIDVEPLDLSGTEELVRALLGGPVSIPALNRLVALGQGLPLAVRELVTGTVRSGQLTVDDGIWILEGDLTLSDRLVDLIEMRLQDCTGAERDALRAVALGDPLPLAVATALIPPEVLQSLEDASLVAIDGESNVVTLTHSLYGEVALHSAGLLHRRRLLSALADAMTTHVDPTPATDLRVAMWLLAAGAEVGAQSLLRGARIAFRAMDHGTTIDLAAGAWRSDRSTESGYLLGLVLSRLNRSDEAEAVLVEAAELLDANPADDRMRVLITLARAENLFRGLADETAAIACVEEAQAKVTDPEWRDELTANLAMHVLSMGDVDGALQLAEPLISPESEGRPFVAAAYAAGIALVSAGQTERASALAERALPVHETVWADDLFQTEPGVHHVTAILALIESGQLTAAQAYADIAVHVVAETSEGYGLGYMSMLAGLVGLRRGHVVTARRRCLDAIPLFRAAGYPSPLRWVSSGAALADALTGEIDSALGHLAAVDQLAEYTPVRLREFHIHEARGWVHVVTGDSSAARACFRGGAEEALGRGELTAAAHLLHTLARTGSPTEVVVPLAEMTPFIDGEFHALRVEHTEALVHGHGDELDRLADAFADSGADLVAAEAAAEAIRAHRRRRDQRAATSSVRRFQQYAARCQGARTPAMAVTSAVEPLTDREREIALLAAEGLPSKEIAERLFVSRRTVDNHLQRVFSKLGISGRGELAEALGSGA